jgi:hypothetical protein
VPRPRYAEIAACYIRRKSLKHDPNTATLAGISLVERDELSSTEASERMKVARFAEVALKAQEKAASRKMNPKDAWYEAALENMASVSSRLKGCPREAFLGLCAAGIVRGIPGKPYTDSKDNKRYAIKAVELHRSEPNLGYDTAAGLWNRVLKELKKEKVHHNQQMHVVLALWTRGLIQK